MSQLNEKSMRRLNRDVWFDLPAMSLVRITRFYVPRRAYDQVDIDCKYDLEGRQLYDVKWYRNGQQFLRCTGDGRVDDFPVEGVTIRHPAFSTVRTVGSCPLTLITMKDQSEDEYKCEVSVDTPDFAIAWNSSFMEFLTTPHLPKPGKEAAGSLKHTSDEEELGPSSGRRAGTSATRWSSCLSRNRLTAPSSSEDNLDAISRDHDSTIRYNVCRDRSSTARKFIFDRRNVQKKLAGLQDEYDILPPEEAPPQRTYKNVTLPLEILETGEPFPEPVKLMPSHTVSDQEKADQMQAEFKVPKFGHK
ncbi:hypothetical protein NQ318_016112 [Aromia moschata]|uniref:Ig-like domain-containing protein n=1 Tax=Aromia moschata TaxID=1265417 RepID=A0AAV8XCU6_9CUCU|nr:hypothetical protein NQ318_016112 [Aromia moschata]